MLKRGILILVGFIVVLNLVTGVLSHSSTSDSTQRSSQVDPNKLVIIAAGPITNHLAGNGRSISVTAEQARQTIVDGLTGKSGGLYLRDDGRMMIVSVRENIRTITFLNASGEMATHFPPAENAQLCAGPDCAKALRYINNVIAKGGYTSIQPSEVPQRIRDGWVSTAAPAWQALLGSLAQTLGASVTEMMVPILILPDDFGMLNNQMDPQS